MEAQEEVQIFHGLLKSLSSSKESINKAAKYALTNAHLAPALLDQIIERMTKVGI
jgi:hypothetical protein